MDFVRLGAMVTAAAALIAVIFNPTAPARLAAVAVSSAPKSAPAATRTCPIAGELFATAFADIDDVISISPLGGVTAPGEPLPAPYIRVNTRQAQNALVRRETTVMAPARAEIVAIERRIERTPDGAARGQSWTVHFDVCEDVSFQIADLDAIDEDLIRRVGGVAAFQELGGPDHTAVEAAIRLRPGDVIGVSDGFDVAVEDRRAPSADLVRPERYQSDYFVAGRAFDVAPSLLKATALDHTFAHCPLDYLPSDLQGEWKELLGDAFGMRQAAPTEDGDACRAALVDKSGAAQGAWFTDAAHNGVASKVSAIALAPDNVDPERQIFALHGRLRSLTPDLVALPPKQAKARAAAALDFLTFDGDADGRRRINQPFDKAVAGQVYCYDGLRANFVGPRINGVILLQVAHDDVDQDAQHLFAASVDTTTSTDTRSTEITAIGTTTTEDISTSQRPATPGIMRMEARADAQQCAALPTPWAFTSAATTFFR